MGYAKRPAPPGALLVSVSEARIMLGVGNGTIQKLLRDGDLPVVRIGRSLRIPREALEAFVAARAGKWAE
ncbi:MAG: hypothetical protein Kow0010_10730 [Dehalococcoidia bacterium]